VEKYFERDWGQGYSSLAVALVLPEWGQLVACERDERCLDVARKYYECAGVTHKVDVRHGLAMDSLQYLLDNGEGGRYCHHLIGL
jgi:predicted O-methyltransferase YrrM